ncbi:hypothetical protein BO83DRAFT_383740 [Aspergillus eucalypticola CBS 122712]|uniref:DUF7624 domain-containing protein n=1 Tax=Aspergillus eucalypticola (strain CBS 122712 / IBT 29274) TaxID=1448314 RepID=A0A317UI85_ASPEC|nr:uncharacterized protein BO83DRAFT_383740 [Aspergillus eucalypticola CBS 122712]PWY61783.1 hypothetical protein BO83DRAFT_383740 [Aspergillus eucalypticola CBS 122712]
MPDGSISSSSDEGVKYSEESPSSPKQPSHTKKSVVNDIQISDTRPKAVPPTATTQSSHTPNTAKTELTIQPMNAISNSNPTKSDEDEPPKSVIHAPTGFGEFVNGVQYFSSPSQSESDGAETLASNVVAPPSVSTGPEQSAKENQYGPTSPPPLTTTSIQPARDWFERATPRAQTRQEFLDISKDVHSTSHKVSEMAVNHCEEQPLFTRPSVNRELAFSRNATAEEAGQHTNGKPESHHSQVVQLSDEESEIRALQAALAECWALCNTLATLSSIHRERHGCTVDTREDVWRSCWRLCQELYDSHSDDRAPQINPTLDLCRDFCQTLFETRVRNDENADSVLRVSFELNNHLYNTHDRNLPDAFRERTLDFYITICHRLMKQRTLVSETDSLLSACWSLAEMLFSIRQSIKEGKRLGEELLGSAVQACWELCDIFREGWTQRTLRNSDRGTPRPSQATFTTQVVQKPKPLESGSVDELINQQGNPETPTTIFDDTATVSPDDAPVQNIFVLGQGPGQSSHAWSSNSSNISGQSQSSEQTSSTQTVKTSSRDPNLACVRILVTQAAINSGFQRVGPHSFPSFVKSLSSDAFGSMPWQVALLKNYKQLVAFDPTFRSVGPSARAGAADVACAVEVMMQSGQHLWLRDLYRLVFGFHIEEAVSRKGMMLQV